METFALMMVQDLTTVVSLAIKKYVHELNDRELREFLLTKSGGI